MVYQWAHSFLVIIEIEIKHARTGFMLHSSTIKSAVMGCWSVLSSWWKPGGPQLSRVQLRPKASSISHYPSDVFCPDKPLPVGAYKGPVQCHVGMWALAMSLLHLPKIPTMATGRSRPSEHPSFPRFHLTMLCANCRCNLNQYWTNS